MKNNQSKPSVWKLSEKGTKIFLDALANPPTPNEKLKEAARLYLASKPDKCGTSQQIEITSKHEQELYNNAKQTLHCKSTKWFNSVHELISDLES